MTIEDEVCAVSAAFDAALISNNASEVASFMDDDWVYVNPEGITPKADIIDWIASDRLAHHSMQGLGTDRVVHAGGTVIVTSRKTSSGTWDGVPYIADEWVSEVYVRTDGHWRCMFSRKSPAAGDFEQQ